MMFNKTLDTIFLGFGRGCISYDKEWSKIPFVLSLSFPIFLFRVVFVFVFFFEGEGTPQSDRGARNSRIYIQVGKLIEPCQI